MKVKIKGSEIQKYLLFKPEDTIELEAEPVEEACPEWEEKFERAFVLPHYSAIEHDWKHGPFPSNLKAFIRDEIISKMGEEIKKSIHDDSDGDYDCYAHVQMIVEKWSRK